MAEPGELAVCAAVHAVGVARIPAASDPRSSPELTARASPGWRELGAAGQTSNFNFRLQSS